MKIEEEPFVIIKDYRKIVSKAKHGNSNCQKDSLSDFTTHESIPQNIKDQINQILFQLTQPQKFNDQNGSRMTSNDDYMDQEEYFYYKKLQMEKREEANHQITDIQEFLSFQN